MAEYVVTLAAGLTRPCLFGLYVNANGLSDCTVSKVVDGTEAICSFPSALSAGDQDTLSALAAAFSQSDIDGYQATFDAEAAAVASDMNNMTDKRLKAALLVLLDYLGEAGVSKTPAQYRTDVQAKYDTL